MFEHSVGKHRTDTGCVCTVAFQGLGSICHVCFILLFKQGSLHP